jgi:hypothetical protein
VIFDALFSRPRQYHKAHGAGNNRPAVDSLLPSGPLLTDAVDKGVESGAER